LVFLPNDASSSEFVAELAALKATSASLTSEQQEAVDYWAGDGLIQWNEIARDLSAKCNIPASPNPDGTYPAAILLTRQLSLLSFAHPPCPLLQDVSLPGFC
jgi:hypothetical protein